LGRLQLLLFLHRAHNRAIYFMFTYVKQHGWCFLLPDHINDLAGFEPGSSVPAADCDC
jgi:hypothetical protein